MHENCPHCGVSLIAEPLPPVADPNGTQLPGSVNEKVMGIEIPEVFDGVLYWMCLSCRGAWHYWTTEWGRRYEAARWHVRLANMHAGVTT